MGGIQWLAYRVILVRISNVYNGMHITVLGFDLLLMYIFPDDQKRNVNDSLRFTNCRGVTPRTMLCMPEVYGMYLGKYQA